MKELQMQFAQLPSIHRQGFSFICCVTVSKFYHTKDFISFRIMILYIFQDYDSLSLSGL